LDDYSKNLFNQAHKNLTFLGYTSFLKFKQRVIMNHDEHNPEAIQKLFIVKLFAALGIIFTFLFGLLCLFEKNTILSLFSLGTSTVLLLNYYLMTRQEKYSIGTHVIVYLFMFLFFYLVYSGGVANTGSLWMYTFPALALSLHGLKHGLVDIAIFIFALLVIFYFGNDQFIEASYTEAYKIHLILSFLMVTLLSALYEYSRIQSLNYMGQLNSELVKNAKDEQLSQLSKQRGLYEELEVLYTHAKENNEKLCIVLCDIDYMHDIFSRFGKEVGNMVIDEITKEIEKSLKNSEGIVRWSGEEFLIILPTTPYADAILYANALEKRIQNYKIKYDGKIMPVSLTTGVAESENIKSIYRLIRQADSKMYNI